MQNKVRLEMQTMTKTEQQVAACFLASSEEFAFCTLDRIAQTAGVSTTSVLRFCRRLGFEGYKDFQDALRTQIRGGMTLPLKLRQNSETEAGALLQRVVSEGMQAIEQTFSALPPELLGNATELLCSSNRVFTFGLRESFALAHYAYTRLTTVRPAVQILRAGADGMMEPLLELRTGDVCLCFLFHRYTELSLRLLPLIRAQGASVILITDAPYDRLSPMADVLLPCHVANTGMKNSALAPVCLTDYFCNAVALCGGAAVQEHLDSTEKLLQQTAVISE